jgi:tRNA(His) guanylyltransferase
VKDDLGNRIKSQYEDRTRFMLPRRTYTIIRLDGKAFHTYVKACCCEKPFDVELIEAMTGAAKYLCTQISGAQFAYVQSDEISVLVTDFNRLGTSAWFDGNLQKIASVSASIVTAQFNSIRSRQAGESLMYCGVDDGNDWPLAFFDSRAFTIPDRTEVANYFIWRQKDCIRNSIVSLAQSMYSHKALLNKSCNEMQEMMFTKGVNWNDTEKFFKNGVLILKAREDKQVVIEGEEKTIQRRVWKDIPAFNFNVRELFVDDLIPVVYDYLGDQNRVILKKQECGEIRGEGIQCSECELKPVCEIMDRTISVVAEGVYSNEC